MYIKVGLQGSWDTFLGGDGGVGASLRGGKVGMKMEPARLTGALCQWGCTGGKGEFSDFQLSLDDFWFMILYLDSSPEYFSS